VHQILRPRADQTRSPGTAAASATPADAPFLIYVIEFVYV